jgi:hypothetical protein
LNNSTRAQDEQGAIAEASANTVTGTFVDAPGGQLDRKMSQRLSSNRAIPSKSRSGGAMSQRRQGLSCQAMNRGVANKMDGAWHSGADRADDGG